MPSAESKKNTADFRAEFWGVSLDGIAGTLGFRMCRRTSLMHVTLTGAVLGVACTGPGTLRFASDVRRCVVYVTFLAARTLPARRPIPPTGDDLLLMCGIAPLLQADSRASPRLKLFACDASPFGAHKCVAPVTAELWWTLRHLALEQGEHVRLRWSSSLLELTTSRCMCCARHSCRLVRALRIPVLGARSHQPSSPRNSRSSDTWQTGERAVNEPYVASTAASSSERFQRAKASQLRTSHSNASVRLCPSTCCGSHLGRTLPTRRREAPRSPAGDVHSPRGTSSSNCSVQVSRCRL